MAYATEGMAATSIRRHSIARTACMTKQTVATATYKNPTRRSSSANNLRKYQQSEGERKDERSVGNPPQLDQGDNAPIYIAKFNYVAQKSLDLGFSKGMYVTISSCRNTRNHCMYG